jgi:hypothetical protein
MSITALHSFLVAPAKGVDPQPAIRGVLVKQEGRLFDMLKSVYDKSDTECNIDISFNSDDQTNECRDQIIKYANKPTIEAGRTIAKRLQNHTTHRSGLGLLFLINGTEGKTQKLVISRFPAEHGVVAEQKKNSLSIKYLEEIFMKSEKAYKAVVYKGNTSKSGFWDGKAIDKQINARLLAVSDYWIKDFLASDFKTTAEAGTKRLAGAIRQALTSSGNLAIKSELVAAGRLASSLDGKTVSIGSVCKQFNLSQATIDALKDKLPSDHLFSEKFKFSKPEFDRHIAFESAELDTGGILMAPAGRFDTIFKEKKVPGNDGEVEFSTKGKVVNRKLRKTNI